MYPLRVTYSAHSHKSPTDDFDPCRPKQICIADVEYRSRGFYAIVVKRGLTPTYKSYVNRTFTFK